VTALLKGRTIEAIQLVRHEQNIGLNEAKDLIDTFLRSQPVLQKRIDEADAREGLLRWLIFLVAGGGGLAYFLT
jgi:ribosomal protein L7/L12